MEIDTPTLLTTETEQLNLSPKTLSPTHTNTLPLLPTTQQTTQTTETPTENSSLNMDIDNSSQYLNNPILVSKEKNKELNNILTNNLTENSQTQTKQPKALFDWLKHFPITEKIKKLKN